jgi:hypothetical protein
MDQPLKSPGQSAVEDAFQRLFELSRTTPAPTLDERLDRLKRLRAAISENEARFQTAISADFGASGSGAYHGEWGFKSLSKLKPVFYRSPFNRLADLYPPYGGKIARLEKMMRFMS